MSAWEMKILTAEARRLMELAEEDAQLRAELRSLALEILGATEIDEPQAPPVAPPAPEINPTPEPLRQLTLGRSRPARIEVRTTHAPVAPSMSTEADLAGSEARCRLKARGARWAAARQRRVREGDQFLDETAPEDPAIAAWAENLTDNYYWANASQPTEISLLDDVSGCFATLAAAMALVRDTTEGTAGRKGGFEKALQLVAEAQSSLRAALHRVKSPEDPDQLDVFEWIKTTAARHHVYLKRFMRADDPADPDRWPELLDRIEREDARHGRSAREMRRHEPSLNLLRSELKAIEEGKSTEEHWRTVIATVETLICGGVAPSNRELRELLLPEIDNLPDRDDLPPGFRLVLREIDTCLATRTPSPGPGRGVVGHEPTTEVKEACRLLSGRSAVMIGGSCRRNSRKVLKAALGLKDLIWIETREHQSVGSFEPAVARSDVAVVLLAIRWSSHAFGDVRHFCDRYHKPLVRLPGGYGPNQVAAQLLAQCSEQLEGPS